MSYSLDFEKPVEEKPSEEKPEVKAEETAENKGE